MASKSQIERVERIAATADMMVTGHSWLRDKFRRQAAIVDITVLALSLWVAVTAFAEQGAARRLTPASIDPALWIAVLGLLAFFAGLVAFKVGWKGLGDAHDRAARIWTEVKLAANDALADETPTREEHLVEFLQSYTPMIADTEPIPERYFLRAKRKHKRKVALSKKLDVAPWMNLTLSRVVLILEDTVRGGSDPEKQDDEAESKS